MRPQRSMVFGEKMSTSSIRRTRPRSSRLSKFGVMPAPSSKKPEEREIVVDPGASMHMLSRTDLSLEELEPLQKSRNTTTAITANGEVPTNEDAHLDVDDLELFVTVQILEDTPAAVLSCSKLCEEHGYSHEWASGQKPQLTKNGKTILCKTDNLVPVVVPGLSSSSASSSSTLFPQDSSGISPSPAIQRDDTHAQTSGNRGDPTKTKNKNNEKDTNQASSNRLRDLTRSVRGVHRQSRRYRRCQHPQTLHKIQIRNVPRKWHQGSICFFLTSRKTKIAKSAREPRL